MTFAYDIRITRHQLKTALKCRVNVSAHWNLINFCRQTKKLHCNYNIACFRLRDSGEKSFSEKKCEKREGAGERQGSSARLIFALLVLIRPHYLSESLAQAIKILLVYTWRHGGHVSGQKQKREEDVSLVDGIKCRPTTCCIDPQHGRLVKCCKPRILNNN